MKVTIYIFAVLTGFLFSTSIMGQYKHEFSAWGAGGLSSLNYKTHVGEKKYKPGGSVGLGYTYFFSTKIGLHSGAELSFSNTDYKLNNLSGNYNTNDGELPFEFRYTINNYKEKQTTTSLNIPLMLQFQSGGTHQFYAAVGGKVGIPLNAKYKAKNISLTTTGYYPQYDIEMDSPAFMGFGTFENLKAKDDYDFKVAYMASAETGYKWRLKEGLSLYTGIYFDYGLNDISKKKQTGEIIVYNTENPREFIHNGALMAHNTVNNNQEILTSKIKPIAAGLKFKLSFGKGRIIRPEPEIAEPVIIKEVEPIDNTLEKEAEAKRRAEEERIRAEREAEARLESELEAKRKAYELAIIDLTEPITCFRINKYALTPAMKEVIDRKIPVMKEYTQIRLICFGHTCSLGGSQLNNALGLKRANSVREYMIEQGIEPERIVIVTKGKTEPAIPDENASNRCMNRRVEFEVEIIE